MGNNSCRKKVTPNDIDESNYYDDPKDLSSVYAGTVGQVKSDKFTEAVIDDENSVLLTKYKGKIYAIGSICPHSGTSLLNAPIKDGRVRCVAHGACFDVTTGDLEDFPGFDCIPTYRVSVSATRKVFVKLNPKKIPLSLTRPMTRLVEKSLIVAIIGGGPAGYSCSQTLRQEGYTGRIVLISAGKYLPYDCTHLSKQLDLDFDQIKIRNPSFYEDNDIEVLLESPVREINPSVRCLFFEDPNKPRLMYDNLFIATGLKPRYYAPSVHGIGLKNIFHFRTYDDYIKLSENAVDKDIVFLGASFVTMELVSTFSAVANRIYIVSRNRLPYGAVLGDVTSKTILKYCLTKLKNVEYYALDDVKKFIGNAQNEVTEVHTIRKRKLKCNIVIVGIGSLPNTEFLEGTGIHLNPIDHSVIVNKFMESSLPQVYAGGDVASYPFHMCSKDHSIVTSWSVACAHGRVAALNMLGREISIEDNVPNFWHSVCGVDVRYIGFGAGYDEAFIYGNLEEMVFCTVYRRRTRLNGVCCVNCGALASQLLLIFEDEVDFIELVPDVITEMFPDPPIDAKAFHAIKMETHTHEHDVEVYKTRHIPMVEPKLIELTKRHVLSRNQPLSFDLSIQLEEEEPDKLMLTDIQSLKRDQEHRRKMEMMRYGEYKGNMTPFQLKDGQDVLDTKSPTKDSPKLAKN